MSILVGIENSREVLGLDPGVTEKTHPAAVHPEQLACRVNDMG